MTSAVGVARSTSSTARAARSWPRAVRTTRAPSRATPLAVASPMPDVAPVTSTVRPASDGGGVQPAVRLRSAGPIEEKLPTTVASSASSTVRATDRPGLGPLRGDRRTAQRAPEPGHPLVADPVEGEREHRVGQGERALEAQVGLVGEDRAAVGGRAPP